MENEAADLTKVVVELIQKRLNQLPALQADLVKKERALGGGKVLKGEARKAFLKNHDLYRITQDLKKEVDHLNRAMSEMLTATGKEQYLLDAGLFDDLFEGVHKFTDKAIKRGVAGQKYNLFGQDLAERIHAFESKLSGFTDAVKSGVNRGTVGHHRHSLSAMRQLAVEAKANSDPKWWSQFVNRLDELGFTPGDLGMDRIDYMTHKPPQKFKGGPQAGERKILGALEKAGITEKSEGFADLYKVLQERIAHAGGTINPKIPSIFAHLDVEDAIEASMPYLELEAAKADTALKASNRIQNWKKGLGDVPATGEDIKKLTSQLSRIKPVDTSTVQKLAPGVQGPNISYDDDLVQTTTRNKKIAEQLKIDKLYDTPTDMDRLRIDLGKGDIAPKPGKVLTYGNTTGDADLNRAYIAGQEYMEELTGAPKGTLRRQMTTADEAKYLQDKIVMKAQIKPKVKPKSVLNLSNVADATAKVGKNSRLARLFIPSSAIGVALAPLTIADAHARSKRAEQTGHWLDKAQARLAQAEATADVTGAVPNPVSEAVGFGAGISNLLIDAGRWGVNKVRGEDPIQQF